MKILQVCDVIAGIPLAAVLEANWALAGSLFRCPQDSFDLSQPGLESIALLRAVIPQNDEASVNVTSSRRPARSLSTARVPRRLRSLRLVSRSKETLASAAGRSLEPMKKLEAAERAAGLTPSAGKSWSQTSLAGPACEWASSP